MKKYNEGDIIYSEGKTFICELASEKKAVFREAKFSCFNNGDYMGFPSLGSTQWTGDSKWLILKEERCPFTTVNAKKGVREKVQSTDYIVIGNFAPFQGALWDLHAIQNFPDLMEGLATTLQAKNAKRIEGTPGPMSKETIGEIPLQVTGALNKRTPRANAALKKAAKRYTKATKKSR
jgi:hypothetical protein